MSRPRGQGVTRSQLCSVIGAHHLWQNPHPSVLPTAEEIERGDVSIASVVCIWSENKGMWVRHGSVHSGAVSVCMCESVCVAQTPKELTPTGEWKISFGR